MRYPREVKHLFMNRLRNHRGTMSWGHAGGENHQRLIFRSRVSEALIEKGRLRGTYLAWGKGSSAGLEIHDEEYEMEKQVGEYI